MMQCSHLLTHTSIKKLFVTLTIITLSFGCSSNIASQIEDTSPSVSRQRAHDIQQAKILDAAKASARLNKECFPDFEGCFIAGDLRILSIDNDKGLIASVQLLPKTTPDNLIQIKLILQNSQNKIIKQKSWAIEQESLTENFLDKFINDTQVEISTFLQDSKLKSDLEKQDISLIALPKDIVLSFSTENKKDTEGRDVLKNILIKQTGVRDTLLGKTSDLLKCPECVNSFYKVDVLGEIKTASVTNRYILLGLLESVEHSPSALHLRLVTIK